jgi:Flp pilus assembly protein TadG
MKALIDRLPKRMREFLADRRGNAAIIFALATVPMVGFVGAAVDYSHASSIKAAMQAAADATALAMSKSAGNLTGSQLQTTASDYFKALFTRPEAQSLAVTTTYNTSGGTSLTVAASANMPTNFMGVMGFKNLAINVTGQAAWGMTRLRVALALDNTGSMADDGKITALKSATKSLLSQLKSAAVNNGDVYVSIIPFSKDVNVGATNYNANWIDWNDWEDDNGHDASTTTCTTTKKGKSGKTTKKCTTSTTWVPDNHNTWNGCITDRDQNYDQLSTPPNPADASLPDSAASTLFPAEQYDSCPLQMMGLSYDWTTMNSLVDQMYPDGNTNQPIGLAWAWHSLTGIGPLSAPVMDSRYQYTQVIILLSDGLNTEDRWYTNQSTIDGRMVSSTGTGTCANIKAAGIILYTIQVNTGGDPTSTLLQKCASPNTAGPVGPKFFLLTSSNQIVSTFNSIGTNLSQLRISK